MLVKEFSLKNPHGTGDSEINQGLRSSDHEKRRRFLGLSYHQMSAPRFAAIAVTSRTPPSSSPVRRRREGEGTHSFSVVF